MEKIDYTKLINERIANGINLETISSDFKEDKVENPIRHTYSAPIENVQYRNTQDCLGYNSFNYFPCAYNNTVALTMPYSTYEDQRIIDFKEGKRVGRELEKDKKKFNWKSCVQPYTKQGKLGIWIKDGGDQELLFCSDSIEDIVEFKEKGTLFVLNNGERILQIFIEKKDLGKQDMLIKLQTSGVKFHVGSNQEKIGIFMNSLNLYKNRVCIDYKIQPGWYLEGNESKFYTAESKYHEYMEEVKTAVLIKPHIRINEYLKEISKDDILLLLIELATVIFPYFNKKFRIPALFIEEQEENFVKVKQELSFYESKRENSIDIFISWKKIKAVIKKLQDEILFVYLGNYRKEYDREVGVKNMSDLLKIAQGETVDGINFRGTIIFIGERFLDEIPRNDVLYLPMPEKFLEKYILYPSVIREWIGSLEEHVQIVEDIVSDLNPIRKADDDLETILRSTLKILRSCGYSVSDEMEEWFLKEYEKLRKITMQWREPEGIGDEFISKLVEGINEGRFQKIARRVHNDEIDSKKISLYYDEEIIAIPYKIFLNKLLSSFNMKMKKPLWVAQELKREGFLRMTQTVGRGFSQQIWINSLKKREYCLVLDKKRLEEEYGLL
ncbi:MAG TPA: hypothetical protein IAC14_05060 [Candidatus Scybalomonas excrementigallinarum]|nr:hypothetical protein [Candidatus Scybalomonas excrementigallinarum]